MKINIHGIDCTKEFRTAYENRYTWNSDFPGYKGTCKWQDAKNSVKGSFAISKDFKVNVDGIKDETIQKLISSQLWEVSIHRVYRSFEATHGLNTFTIGDINDVGMEVIVGGKSKGDSYRIKNNVITMVNRYIHGTLIQIFTERVLTTDKGYLSQSYTSQYLDPTTKVPIKGMDNFVDSFVPLYDGGPLVLSKRSIHTDRFKETPSCHQTFSFIDLYKFA